MYLDFSGRIGSDKYDANEVVVPLKLNVPIPLPFLVSTPKVRLSFFVQVVEVLPENLAVLAIGPKDPASIKKT